MDRETEGQGARYSLERSPLHYGLPGICWREGTGTAGWGRDLAHLHLTPLPHSVHQGGDTWCSLTCVPASPIMGGDTWCSLTCVRASPIVGGDTGCSVTCVPASPIMGQDTGCSVTCVPASPIMGGDTDKMFIKKKNFFPFLKIYLDFQKKKKKKKTKRIKKKLLYGCITKLMIIYCCISPLLML